MGNSILTRKLFELPRPNWWLWLVISIPLWIYFFFVPSDRVHDFTISDSQWIADYLHSVGFIRLFRSSAYWQPGELGGAVLDGFGIPIVIGYFAQYAVLFIWRAVRHQPIFKA